MSLLVILAEAIKELTELDKEKFKEEIFKCEEFDLYTDRAFIRPICLILFSRAIFQLKYKNTDLVKWKLGTEVVVELLKHYDDLIYDIYLTQSTWFRHEPFLSYDRVTNKVNYDPEILLEL